MPTEPPCLVAALAYLAEGWSAIPLCPPDHQAVYAQHAEHCASPGKSPLWQWAKYQTQLARPTELRMYWSRNRHCNVGVALGPVSGLVGLDIDAGGESVLQELSAGDLPPTLEFSTPAGGRRLLYLHPAAPLSIRSFAGADGKEALRILAQGSQTVMPPSIHRCGKPYEWRPGHTPADRKPAACPPWVSAFSTGPVGDDQGVEPSFALATDAQARAKTYLAKCDPAVSGQGGHKQLFKVACKLVKGFGLAPADALALLVADYNPRCQPPWTDKELHHKVAEAAAKGVCANMLTKPALLPLPKQQPSVARKFSDIAPKALHWLFKDRIPLGKVTVFDGDPGLGKSTLLLDLAARLSRHGVMPDGSQIPTGNVLIMSAEDDPADTIRPRLELADANLERIHFLDEIDNHPVEIPKDLPAIEQAIQAAQAQLVVIDPLMAFLDKVDANSDQSIRRALFAMSKVARNQGCAIICQRHLNKGNNPKAMYRGGGSIAIIGHARSALLVAEDPDDSSKRLLAVVKRNRGAPCPTLRFTLDPVAVTVAGEPDTICRIGWCGTSNYTADQLVKAPPTEEEQEKKEEEQSKQAQAESLLQTMLEGQDHIDIKQAKTESRALGISDRSLRRAAKQLSLIIQYEALEDGKRVYFWTNP